MKPVSHPKYFLLLLLAFGLMLGAGLRAANPEAAEPAPDAPPAPTAPVAPAEPASAPEPAEGEMRELTATDAESAGEDVEKSDEDGSDNDGNRWHKHSRHGSGDNERVSFGSDSTLAEGETAQAVVSIIGNSTSAGEVRDAVVSILGGSRVTGGKVGNAVVSVLGNTYINGEVRGEVVTVLGNVELGPKAVVHGEIVCVGGQVQRDPAAVVRGNVQNIAVAGQNFDFSGLTVWFTECLIRGRLLAFDSRVMWAWTIALVALGFYALIALIAPGGVNKCVDTLEQRPGYSLLAALLTLLLTPVAYILLALTITIVIGIVLIPVFSLGLFFASLFGKIVMLAWLGRRFTKLLGDGPLAHPVFGVLIGGVVMLMIYTTPYVGFIAYKLLGILGLGVVVYTLILMAKASRPPRPVPVGPAAGVAPPPVVPSAPVSGVPSGVAAAPVDATGMVPPPVPPPVAPLVSAAPPVISAATLPRAGFWIRVAACVLDAILVGIVFGMLEGMLGWLVKFGGFPLWFVVYNVVMWATKGTTIGGIICGLKVVRTDDRPLDWSVAIVRALSAFLSLVVAGVGFIWVSFDDERQSWHDKIAGTTIVKVPKGTALL
jgi:uncharacterized RDD family membrane protein YckC